MAWQRGERGREWGGGMGVGRAGSCGGRLETWPRLKRLQARPTRLAACPHLMRQQARPSKLEACPRILAPSSCILRCPPAPVRCS